VIVPLLLALAADPSPSLEAIVKLGRGTDPAASTTTASPAPSTSPTAAASTAPATSTLSTQPSSTSTPFPWAATGAVVLLGGVTFGLWWKKRHARTAPERALRLDDTLGIGRDRALLVCEVDGRRFLLASTPGGVNLLADLGTARPQELSPYVPLSPLSPPPQDDAFAMALERELAPVTVSTSMSTAPSMATAASAAPATAATAKTVDVEGQEIQRRLRLLGQNGPQIAQPGQAGRRAQ
jgi:hypothetical protein